MKHIYLVVVYEYDTHGHASYCCGVDIRNAYTTQHLANVNCPENGEVLKIEVFS